MASGAGVNTVGNLGGIPLLNVPANSAVVQASTTTLPTTYGTNNGIPPQSIAGTPLVNGTTGNDSGVQMLVAKGFTKWAFSIVGPGRDGTTTAAVSVMLLGTIDPTLLAQSYQTPGTSGFGGFGQTMAMTTSKDPTYQASLTAIPATSWFILPGPSEQTGTGSIANPLVTGTNPLLTVSMPLVAVRAIVVGTAATTSQPITVVGFAVP